MDFKEAILSAVIKATGVDVPIEVPPNSELGDYAIPCFVLAKAMKKAPMQVAQELAKSLKIKGIARIETKGPYLNFFVEKGILSTQVLDAILTDKHYGSAKKKAHALLEHTSVNPNAEPHLGRARNAMIGDAVARILRFQGYKLDVHYFVNDIGKQIAMLVLACKGKKPSFADVLKLYVDFNKELEQHAEIEQEIFALLKKLEDGDKATIKKFRDVVDICVAGQKAILNEFGITFDSFDYESDYLFNKKTDDVLKKLEKTGKLSIDQSQQVLDLKGNPEVEAAMEKPLLVLTRNDGTSLYPLRDIAYSIDKAAWAKDRNIVILGEDQKLYFQEVAIALKLLGVQPPESVHYSFVLLSEGKMSTRKGTVVMLSDFMKEASEKAKKEILARDALVPDEKLTILAKQIGYGAVKYSILKVSPEKNVTFDWNQALSFEGDASPYIQYAHARINSLLEKAGKRQKPDYTLLTHKAEIALITQLGTFPDIVKDAEAHLSPHGIANYAKELAQAFTSFYHECPVMTAEGDLKHSRLALCEATKRVLATSLHLLGIDAPDEM